jgi:antitoxin component YwqK of YwqJK toxin-antitoxin module
VARTGTTSGGTQHPTYDYRMTGRGDLPLTDVAQGTARIVLPPEMSGVVSVLRLPDRTPLAEVAKTSGAPVRVAVPPGSYALVLREGSRSAEATIGLSEGAERVVAGLAFAPVEVELASAKGTDVVSVFADVRRQVQGAVTTVLDEIGGRRAPAPPESAPTHAHEWTGDVAAVIACADRGQGCLAAAFGTSGSGDGPIVGRAADGSIVFSGVATHGLPSGYWTFFHPSGAKHCEGVVSSGVKQQEWTCRYESGALESRTEYRADFEVGTVREYFANGQMKRRVEMTRGIASGRSVEWYENGRKRSEGRLAGGHPVGAWTTYFDTGGKQEQGHYDERGKTGRWLAWYANGQKASDGRFVMNARDGEWALWWPDGRRRATGRYERGLEVGHWREWHENGHRASEGRYAAGNKIGKWREWDETGARVKDD